MMEEYSQGEFREQKEKHREMKKLYYLELKMQNYLKSRELTKSQKINSFKYRTHMANFR